MKNSIRMGFNYSSVTWNYCAVFEWKATNKPEREYVISEALGTQPKSRRKKECVFINQICCSKSKK